MYTMHIHKIIFAKQSGHNLQSFYIAIKFEEFWQDSCNYIRSKNIISGRKEKRIVMSI